MSQIVEAEEDNSKTQTKTKNKNMKILSEKLRSTIAIDQSKRFTILSFGYIIAITTTKLILSFVYIIAITTIKNPKENNDKITFDANFKLSESSKNTIYFISFGFDFDLKKTENHFWSFENLNTHGLKI
jgi:hypothetical protein